MKLYSPEGNPDKKYNVGKTLQTYRRINP